MKDEQQNGLAALMRRGPTPRYRIRALVLAQWSEIEAARRLPCTWAEIAVALGLREDQWRSVYRAYHKIRHDYGGPPPTGLGRHAMENPAEAMKGSSKNIKIDL